MELGAVGLDRHPSFDDEIDAAHAGDANLRAHPQAEVQRDHPHDRLEPRLGPRIDQRECASSRLRKTRPQLSQLGRPQRPDVQRAVDAGDPCSPIEASMCLDEGTDDVDMTVVAERSVIPVPSEPVVGQPGGIPSNPDMELRRIEHPDSAVSQLGNAGQRPAGPHRRHRCRARIRSGEVTDTQPDERAPGDGRPDLLLGQTSSLQLAGGEVIHAGRMRELRTSGRAGCRGWGSRQTVGAQEDRTIPVSTERDTPVLPDPRPAGRSGRRPAGPGRRARQAESAGWVDGGLGRLARQPRLLTSVSRRVIFIQLID